jgi:hypothetical protein
MKLEHFEDILKEYRQGHKMISELYDIGFNLLDGKYPLDEPLYNIFMMSLETHYTNDGIEWVSWFIFENEWGETDRSKLPVYRKNESGVMELDLNYNGHAANDENGNPICYDIKSLWEYIEEHHKLI